LVGVGASVAPENCGFADELVLPGDP
jgi:hypothetical protein